MDKYIVFGSKFWDGCDPVKEFLSQKGVKYAYLDITENMFNLKQFLKYRDNNSMFDDAKKGGLVGIPVLVVNHGERIIFDIEEYFSK